MTDNPTEITTVCYVRAPLLLEPVDAQVETLQACESEGAVDDLLLRSWPKEVALSEEPPTRKSSRTSSGSPSGPTRRGVSVRPPFRKRTTTSQVTGTTRERLVTPLLCLKLYADDELIGVFPTRTSRQRKRTRQTRRSPRSERAKSRRRSGQSGMRTRASSRRCRILAPTAAAL